MRRRLFLSASIMGGLIASFAMIPSVLMAAATDLNNVIVYPNPYKPSTSAARVVTFDNVTAGALRLKIYKLTGEIVYDAQHDGATGKVQWPVVDNGNNPVASGLYLYVISDPSGHKVKGKIAVIK